MFPRCMTEKKKEVPKHIAEFYDRDHKVNRLLEAMKEVHTKAYIAGLDAIRDAETGQPDHEKLNDTKVQDAMLDKMVESYISGAMERLVEAKGLPKPKDDFEKELFMQRYVGITPGELRRYLRENKSKYTQEAHEKSVRDKVLKGQKDRLMPLRHTHLEKTHIDDILAHTGVARHIRKDHDLQVDQVVPLLELYKERGEITLADLGELTNQWGTKVYLTPEAKEAAKKVKDKYKQAA